MYKIYKMGVDNLGNKASIIQKMCVGLGSKIVFLMWIAQFLMLINYRFSHCGKVCSGDYAIQELAD